MVYDIISKEQFIRSANEQGQIKIVYGGFFGDEAKGKTVDSLDSKITARDNSGENAGHTVYFNGKKYVFHLVPSSILSGKQSLIASGCVMDPVSLMETEIQPLIDNNIKYDNLIIGNTSIVTIWHKLADAILTKKNGSTMKGMSPIHSDIVRKKEPRLEDILNGNYEKFDQNMEDWFKVFEGHGYNQKRIKEEFSNHPKLPNYIKDFVKLDTMEEKRIFTRELYSKTVTNNPNFPKTGDTEKILKDAYNRGNTITLEGPQSHFLSNRVLIHKSSSTSADTTAKGIMLASDLPVNEYYSIGVVKLPSSRVGWGANPAGYVNQNWFADRKLTRDDLKKVNIDYKEAHKQFIDSIDKNGFQDSTKIFNGIYNFGKEKLTVNEAYAIASCIEHGEFGATTGKPRIVGSLDLPHLKYIIDSGEKNFSISAVDRLNGLNKVPVVVGYEYRGDGYNTVEKTYKKGDKITLEDTLPNENVLTDCRPIYEVLDGWNSVNNGNKLHKNVDKFIDYVSKKTGANIVSIGTGPETHEMLYLEKNN